MCPNWAQLHEMLTGFVTESAEEDENQIQNPANAEETDCEQPDNSRADFSNIESVDAQIA